MATKKRYSDINKAIKEAEARREEYYKQVGRVMLEEYPELGDMNVTDMRRAARFLRDNAARKGVFEGWRSGQGDRPERSARRVRFGRRFRPRCTRAYARDEATARACKARQSCLHPAPRKGCPACPVPNGCVLPSRRLKPVGNRAPLGVRRGQRKLPPRERDV